MNAIRWLLVGCALFTVSTALPLNVGGLLTGNTLTNLVGTVDGVVPGLLGTLDDLLKSVSAEVAVLINELGKILGVATGQNPLAIVANLVTELEAIIEKLLNVTSTLQLKNIIAQLTQLLKIADGINLESFLAKLIVQLDSLLQQLLSVVSKVLNTVSGITDKLPLVGEILNDLQVIQLVQRLIFDLKLVLFLVNLFVKLGGLNLLL